MLRYALQNKTKLTRQLKKEREKGKQSLTQIKYHVRKAQTVLSLPQQDMVYSSNGSITSSLPSISSSPYTPSPSPDPINLSLSFSGKNKRYSDGKSASSRDNRPWFEAIR